MLAPDPFTWQDGERTIVFGRGTLAQAGDRLGDNFLLLTTERARTAAPELAERARRVLLVPPGRVDEIAGDLLGDVTGGELVVALGGGRVIDTAKALAAARRGRAAAIPTTLSGAEMTGIHRPARGAPAGTWLARCALVISDPALSASQPPPSLAASAANALGHAVEAPLTPRANPVSTLAALAAAPLLLAEDPDSIALGALLAGYSIDSAGYGLQHVLAQTLVRFAGAGHGPANAVLLPRTLPALRRRFPERIGALDEALGRPAEEAAEELRARSGVERLRDARVERVALGRCADEAAARPDLAGTPPAADRDEILAIYKSSW